MKPYALCLCLTAVLLSCTPRNAGKLTLVNSGVETIQVTVDNRTFTIKASNHITKDIAAGTHTVRVNDEEPITAVVEKGMTTLFDSTGLSCFVVVDYAQRERGGNPQIVDRIVEQKLYITSKPMAAVLGSRFPKKLPKDNVFRIQQVDCEIVNDDAKLLEELGDLP